MDNYTYLIHVKNLRELDELVFNKKLSNESFRGYVSCMYAESEKYLISDYLKTKDVGLFDFIKKYIQHFPLCSDAVLLLIENSEDTEVKELLTKEWQKYGANEAESDAFCKKLRKQKELDEELLATFCDCARLTFDDTAYNLSLIDNKWSQRYINASKQYLRNVAAI